MIRKESLTLDKRSHLNILMIDACTVMASAPFAISFMRVHGES